MKSKHILLFTLIFEDGVRTLLLCFFLACGMMVTFVPESNELVLRWDASKLVPAAIAWIVLMVIAGIVRFQDWSRSRSALIQRMSEAPPDTWVREFQFWRRGWDRHD